MNKKNMMPNPDDIELSDEELRNLERDLKKGKKSDLGGEDEHMGGAIGDVDLDDLEKEIMSMDGGSEPAKESRNEPQGKKAADAGGKDGKGKKEYNPMEEEITPKTKAKEKESAESPNPDNQENFHQMIELEDVFHGLPCIFGQAIEVELNTTIPELKEKYEKSKNEAALDYVVKLSSKERDLLKFRSEVMERARKGDLTPEKYKKILQKAIDRNNEALLKAQKQRIPQLHLNRISKRLELLGSELKGLEEPPVEEEIKLPLFESPENKVIDVSSKNIATALLEESKTDFATTQNAQKPLKPVEPIKPTVEKPAPQPEPKDFKKPDPKTQPTDQPKSDPPTKKKEPVPEVKSETTPSKGAAKAPEQPKEASDAKKDPTANMKDPALVHFAQKIAMYMNLVEYLKEYFSEERPNDIKKNEETIVKMKELLSQMKAGKKHPTVEELDIEFPTIDATKIIGMTRKERNHKIEEINGQIRKEIEAVGDKNLKKEYTTHYLGVVTNLKGIAESSFGVLPKMTRKSMVINYPDSNPQLTNSQLLIRPLKVYPVLDKRYFFILFEFSHNDKPFSFESRYCESGGAFDSFQVLDLGDDFGKSIMKDSIKCTLRKKKFLLASRVVSTTSFNLQKLANFCTFKTTITFPYKNNTVINADIQIQIRKPFGKPQKEIELLCIEKSYPIFSIKRTSVAVVAEDPSSEHQAKADRPEKPGPNQKPAPVEKGPAQPAPKKPETGHAEPPSDLDSLEKAKFKYPLVPAATKKKLEEACKKNNMPMAFVDFEEKRFCLTFLEEFSTELETQITFHKVNGDRETAKLGEKFYMACQNYLKTLNNNLQEEKMTKQQYEDNLKQGLEADKKLLEFYTKSKISQAITFLNNRIAVLNTEIKQLQESS